MKIELFKKQFKKYRSVSHSDTNELRTHFDYDYYRNEKSTGLLDVSNLKSGYYTLKSGSRISTKIIKL